MEELGVGDSTQLYAFPQGHNSPIFLSEEIVFRRFLLLVCNRGTTSFGAVFREQIFLFLNDLCFFLVFYLSSPFW